MAALFAVMAVPAFAAKGGVGKETRTGDCDIFDPPLNCSITQAGKEGNFTNGPGRTDITVTGDASLDGSNDEAFGFEGTSSGGGGRCEFDSGFTGSGDTVPGSFEDGKGKDAPCPGLT